MLGKNPFKKHKIAKGENKKSSDLPNSTVVDEAYDSTDASGSSANAAVAAQIQEKINSMVDDLTGRSIKEMKALRVCEWDAATNSLRVGMRFSYPAQQSVWQAKIKDMLDSLQAQDLQLKVNKLEIDFKIRVQPHQANAQITPVPKVKNIIAVASAKGGVGKSTTAIALAWALQSAGAKVGLLDADIYGPNQPHLLGVSQRAENSGKRFTPVAALGMPTMSIGYCVDTSTPLVWRGPMVSGALQQLVRQTDWPACDYLIIDLPPGTGDIQLTLAKQVPLAGVVMVTTPQTMAVLDAVKGIEMFKKVDVPVLGVIENMAYHACSACGHQDELYGREGGAALAEQYNVPLLASIPLHADCQKLSDKGGLVWMHDSANPLQEKYSQAIMQCVAQLSNEPPHYASQFPPVVTESDSG